MLGVFRAGLATYQSDPDYARKLQAHAAQFTWERAAQGYLALYREVVAANARRSAA
jgi:glycogen synthase